MAESSFDRAAFTAHLAGAAFGLAYYWFNWRLATEELVHCVGLVAPRDYDADVRRALERSLRK